MGRACSTYGEKRNAYMILVGKLGGNRPLGRPKRRWEWHGKELSGSIKCCEMLEQLSDWRLLKKDSVPWS
jgi:hypothetical protein